MAFSNLKREVDAASRVLIAHEIAKLFQQTEIIVILGGRTRRRAGNNIDIHMTYVMNKDMLMNASRAEP